MGRITYMRTLDPGSLPPPTAAPTRVIDHPPLHAQAIDLVRVTAYRVHKTAATLRDQRRARAGLRLNNASSSTQMMDVITVRLVFNDTAPTYCSEACTLDALYKPGLSHAGDPSIADMLKHTSYGKLELVPRAQAKAITVNMGTELRSKEGHALHRLLSDAADA